jgi:hypothetical protein
MGYDFRRGRLLQNGIENHKSFGRRAPGRADLRLRWRSSLQRNGYVYACRHPSGRAYNLSSDGRKSAGGFDLDRQQWRDQLSRQAGDHERWTLYPNSFAGRGELHRYRTHQRYELLLRGLRVECGGREREFEPGFCDPGLHRSAATTRSRCTHGPHSDNRESADRSDLEREQWCDQLSRETRLHDWRTVHSSECANQQQLHQHRPDQWHDLLLRCISAECQRRECKLKPSQRNTCRNGG